ncbi:MAG: PLP-dependent aminotransferase family protein [Burkholderiales bacterium]|nr:PLP-dependent aminotransferase family protein [Burkholderiales bacterium]
MRQRLSQLWHTRFARSDPREGLQHRIADMLRRAVLERAVPLEAPLPSTRELAGELRVARATVALAYERLEREGVIAARERRGYFVTPEFARRHSEFHESDQLSLLPAPDWSRHFRLADVRYQPVRNPADWWRYRYPFVYGQIDPRLFPLTDWRDCVEQASRQPNAAVWALDRGDQDDADLLEQLRTRVLPRRGVWAAKEEILVTLGAQQALYLIGQLLGGSGRRVVVEEPCYPDLRAIFALTGATLLPQRIDGEGLPVAPLRALAPDVIAVTPSHHCPSGVRMGEERRRALLAIAADTDALIIEDDYEPQLGFGAAATPALKSLDANDRVFHVGSLSKTLAPGLRLGYVVAPREAITELRRLRRLMLRHVPGNNEQALARFLAQGHFEALQRRLGHAYPVRLSRLREALAEQLPDWRIATPIEGGSSLWIELPRGVSPAALIARAREAEVIIEPGEGFFAAPTGASFVRMGIAAIATHLIGDGVAALAAAARDSVKGRSS